MGACPISATTTESSNNRLAKRLPTLSVEPSGVVYDDPGERVLLPTGWTTTSDPAVIEADRVALREVAWVTREALALVREGVAQDVEFLARKRRTRLHRGAEHVLTRTREAGPPRGKTRGGAGPV